MSEPLQMFCPKHGPFAGPVTVATSRFTMTRRPLPAFRNKFGLPVWSTVEFDAKLSCGCDMVLTIRLEDEFVMTIRDPEGALVE